MEWRQSRQEDVARGAIILLISVGIALLIVGARVGTDRFAAPTPTPTPLPTATPLPTPTATPEPPTPTPLPQPPTPTPVPVPVEGVDELYAQDGRNIVCLDPGHGGEDLGNVLLEGGEIVLQEKDFTLEHSLLLAERLREQGYEVVLTRDTDTEVNPSNEDVNGDGVVAEPDGPARTTQLDDLQARVNICNLASADLLISVHYNGAENEFLQGYEVWYNGDRPFSGRSETFANLIHKSLGNAYANAGYDAFDKGIGLEDHVVTGPARPGELVPSEMPGVVVEGLFLSNEEDAAFIQSDIAAETIVGAYEEAINGYFDVYPG
ncbi:MAG: cell wall hydrolase/autolysin [Thermomicrobiales bacterium]|jgi:N-acetylmuramoyl-L-alanine amidase|nr:cell wall hydrolase/autolysin [Thermomicrobiales bacterium]MDF3037794.1 cell wall hydrolase/autolysin [Thermomicrobiales bacterium]